MRLTHAQVHDVLEPYALGALSDADAQAVTAHLATCPSCRDAFESMADAVAALADSLPPREPSPRLRERILATAAADTRRRAVRDLLGALRRPSLAFAVVLLGIVVVSGAIFIEDQRQLIELRAERQEYFAIALSMSEAGRWWYMAGTGDFDGSGGTLVAARKDGRAFVLFHDLKATPVSTHYVVWLIKPDGGWVRAVDFAPAGQSLQRVDLPFQVSDFVRCAVTLETSAAGKRAGPVVMESRIFTPQ